MDYKAFMIKYAEIGTRVRTDIYLKIFCAGTLTGN